MKAFTFLFTLLFFPGFSFAAELDDQINKACLRHAVSLVAKLKTEVVGDLNQEKSDQALKLATDSCQSYFKKEFSQNPTTISTAQKTEKTTKEESKIDWLTEKILSGDDTRKEGNKRLKRIK